MWNLYLVDWNRSVVLDMCCRNMDCEKKIYMASIQRFAGFEIPICFRSVCALLPIYRSLGAFCCYVFGKIFTCIM